MMIPISTGFKNNTVRSEKEILSAGDFRRSMILY